MKPTVFLDRDGVLNQVYVRNGKPYSPDTIDEMVVVSDAAEALARLKSAGFRLLMATNQPDIARGRITRSTVDGMNGHLLATLPLDGAEVCPHDDGDRCNCRKPLPGLLLTAATRDGLDLSASFMIGDRWRDVEAGKAAGCRTVLIGSGYNEPFRSEPDVRVDSLTGAVDWILKQDTNAG